MSEMRETDVSAQRYVYLVPKTQSDIADEASDVGLQNLWDTVLERWRVVLLFVVIGAIAGSVYALLATPWYRAQVVLSPVSEKSVSGALGALGGLGDLASIAGISIPSGRDSAPLAVLKSKSFARQFIEDEKLLPVLLADKWDARTDDWKEKGPDRPDIRDGVKFFDEKVRIVTEDKKANLITLAIEWKDPNEAARWANLLVRRLNDRVRSEAIREAETSIGYLQKEMLATSVVSLQQAVGRVLESEMQKMTLARANEEFAFKVVDEAFPPKKRVFPQRTLIAVTSAVLGALLGIFYVAVSQRWRRKS